jgi:hypothetical protein
MEKGGRKTGKNFGKELPGSKSIKKFIILSY